MWSKAWRTARPGRPWCSAMLPSRRDIAKENKKQKTDRLPDVFVYIEWNLWLCSENLRIGKGDGRYKPYLIYLPHPEK